MTSKKIMRAALTAALLLTGAQAGAVNLVVNGGFEAPVIGEAPGNGCTVGAANSWIYCASHLVPGWSVVWTGSYLTGDPGNLEFQNASTGYGPIPEGVQIAELASAPAGVDARVRISQTINDLCPLDEYTLSFSARNRDGNDQLTYTVDGASYIANSVFGAWTLNTEIFTPLSSSAEISFQETGGAGTVGTVLDNIQLVNNAAFSECDKCWEGETAWSAGYRYNTERGNWATYTQLSDGEVDIFAGRTIYVGKATFASTYDHSGAEMVTITITLEGARFALDEEGYPVEENLKIQGYDAAPSGNPSPGGFAYKFTESGTSAEVTVGMYDFYGVHLDVEVVVDCPVEEPAPVEDEIVVAIL